MHFRSNHAPKTDTPWRTGDEINFIKGIGSRSYLSGLGHKPITQKERIEKVKAYKEVLEKRSDWGEMDRKAVLEFIDKFIAELTVGFH